MTMLKRLDFNSNPYLGVFCRANNRLALIDPSVSAKEKELIADILRVQVVDLTVGGGTIAGSLLAANSHGAVVTDFVTEEETAMLEELFDRVLVIRDRFNAAGNNILANDHGALVHPMLKDETIKDIKGVLDVEVERGTIADMQTVGMAAVATNRGVLCHPRVRDEEKQQVERLLGVEANIGTVNHGVPYVGAGMVANDHGAVMGSPTTGIEMGRVEDALHLG